jgi:hypothetical protein
MKKITFIMIAVFITSNIVAQSTQKSSVVNNSKAFLVLSAGPSIPVGVFRSTDAGKSGAGYANLGYNVNLNAGYQITDMFGIAGTLFYSRYNVDQKLVDNLNSLFAITPRYSFETDHWQYGGIVVGPMVTVKVIDNVMLDFKAMAGFARVNSPRLKISDAITGVVLATSEDRWTDAFALQVGSNLRYNFASRLCAFVNMDYGFMHPKWKGSNNEDEFKQEMGVVDFNIGIGTIF